MAKPNNKETNIRSYYSEVNKFGQNGEYDKAIKSLNKSNFQYRFYDSVQFYDSLCSSHFISE